MIEEATEEINIGLSAEERTELAELITSLRADKQTDSTAVNEYAAEQDIKALQEKLSRCSEIILNFDARMKALYDIVCLFYEKSAMMNARINTIADAIISKTL
jgi:hypothetical protein